MGEAESPWMPQNRAGLQITNRPHLTGEAPRPRGSWSVGIYVPAFSPMLSKYESDQFQDRNRDTQREQDSQESIWPSLITL
jgi:hypothetical protein